MFPWFIQMTSQSISLGGRLGSEQWAGFMTTRDIFGPLVSHKMRGHCQGDQNSTSIPIFKTGPRFDGGSYPTGAGCVDMWLHSLNGSMLRFLVLAHMIWRWSCLENIDYLCVEMADMACPFLSLPSRGLQNMLTLRSLSELPNSHVWFPGTLSSSSASAWLQLDGRCSPERLCVSQLNQNLLLVQKLF